jgi:hypothetical protein
MVSLDSLTAKSWLSLGWMTFKSHPVKLVLSGMLLFACQFVWESPIGEIGKVKEYTVLLIGAVAVWWLFWSVLSVGWSFFCLRLVRGRDVPLWAMFDGFRRPGSVVLMMLCYVLIVGLGCLLLVIPGIIWGIKYSQAFFALMDRKIGAIEAIKLSGKITTGYKGKLFILGLIFIPLRLLGTETSSLGAYMQSRLLIYLGTAFTLAQYCFIYPWLGCAYATAYDGLLQRETETYLEGQETSGAVSISPDVKRDILSGQFSKQEIMIKYAMRPEELEEIYKKLEGKI